MSYKTLAELYAEHEGKVTDKWSLYLEEYDRIFNEYRAKPINMLEIGIQNGGSLEIWPRYFPNGEKFVGCDINPDCSLLRYKDPRITLVIGDANSDSTQEVIFQHSREFDIVIDDGSHLSGDIVKSFVKYFPKIIDGGIFVAEDLHCSYWQGYEGGLFDPFSAITFFKYLADIINYEHWGLEKARVDILQGFVEKYGLVLDEDFLEQVHSIEFVNSICVVRKLPAKRNLLGDRIVVGENDDVVTGLQKLSHEVPPQVDNSWSLRDRPPAEELALRIQELNDREELITALNQAVAEQEEQINRLNQNINECNEEITSLNQAVIKEKRELEEILASKSWKITRPLRFAGRVFIGYPSSVARRVFSGTGYVLWRALPISIKSKQKLKGKLFKTLPWAFHRTNAYHVWNAYSQSSNCSPVINLRDEQTEGAANEYVPLLDAAPLKQKPAKLICFYLPQFHAIPENDEWWGEGFTEWTNVKPAQPQFEGHYQPHVPGELGYYNLLDPAVQRRQVELAKLYGIGGFCFYFYWFGGKRLLEKPIENYLNDDALDLPFCLCWANENWSRRWDGLDNDILISQHHSEEDDLAFIKHISKYLKDSRYIRIDDKPLLLVYRPSLLPSAKETVRRWREWCRENGIGEIYLTCTQSFDTIDPIEFGFDAAVEFPPNNTAPPSITEDIPGCSPAFAGQIYDWRVYPERSKNYQEPPYTLFRGVNPSWDNTARKKENGTILYGSSPLGYQQWLTNAIQDTVNRFPNHDQRLVFINAWNEWAEGAHLEPDQQYGYAYLEATRMAQIRTAYPASMNTDALAIIIHVFYEDIYLDIMERLEGIKGVSFKLFVTTPREKSDDIDSILKSSGFEYHLLPVDNHGRDVLPFLKIIQRVVDEGYAYILKIHTKKSKHRGDGDIWRKDIYDKLLSKESMLKAIIGFKKDENLGLIGPAGHIVSMGFYWGSNKRMVESFATRMGQTVESIKSLNFVAGNMFFARVDALLPLLNLAMSEDDFEQEAGQVDGTLAHAIERLIPISAKAKSYELIDTNMNRAFNETKSYKFA